jgi:transcriptional regulator with XRE-family HTH domain
MKRTISPFGWEHHKRLIEDKRMQKDFNWEEVGARVRRWRLDAGLTQRQLAALAGLTQPGLAAIERGGNDPRLSTLNRLAHALGRSTRELVCGEQARPSEKVSRVQNRVRLVLESNNRSALAIFRRGLEGAELLMSRRFSPEPCGCAEGPEGCSAHKHAEEKTVSSDLQVALHNVVNS